MGNPLEVESAASVEELVWSWGSGVAAMLVGEGAVVAAILDVGVTVVGGVVVVDGAVVLVVGGSVVVVVDGAVVVVVVVVVVGVGSEASTCCFCRTSQFAGPSWTKSFTLPRAALIGTVLESEKAPEEFVVVDPSCLPSRLMKMLVPTAHPVPETVMGPSSQTGLGFTETAVGQSAADAGDAMAINRAASAKTASSGEGLLETVVGMVPRWLRVALNVAKLHGGRRLRGTLLGCTAQ